MFRKTRVLEKSDTFERALEKSDTFERALEKPDKIVISEEIGKIDTKFSQIRRAKRVSE